VWDNNDFGEETATDSGATHKAVIILAPQDPGGNERNRGGLGWRRPWRAREREPITGVWGPCPQRGPGAEPLVRGSGGRSPPEAESFLAFGHPTKATKFAY